MDLFKAGISTFNCMKFDRTVKKLHPHKYEDRRCFFVFLELQSASVAGFHHSTKQKTSVMCTQAGIHHIPELVRDSMVRPQISSEAPLPGYVQEVAHGAAVLSADGKVSHRLPPSILSNHTAVC